jgi:hypothetical protein
VEARLVGRDHLVRFQVEDAGKLLVPGRLTCPDLGFPQPDRVVLSLAAEGPEAGQEEPVSMFIHLFIQHVGLTAPELFGGQHGDREGAPELDVEGTHLQERPVLRIREPFNSLGVGGLFGGVELAMNDRRMAVGRGLLGDHHPDDKPPVVGVRLIATLGERHCSFRRVIS